MKLTKAGKIKKVIALRFEEAKDGIEFYNTEEESADWELKWTKGPSTTKYVGSVKDSEIHICETNHGNYFTVSNLCESEQFEVRNYYNRLANPYVLNKDVTDFMATIGIPAKDYGYQYIGTVLQRYRDPIFLNGMKGVLKDLGEIYGQKPDNIDSAIVTAIRNSCDNMPRGPLDTQLVVASSKRTGYPTMYAYLAAVVRAYQHYLKEKKEG